MIAHHPPAEMLADYASGAAPAALALLVASHATLCPECRISLRALETAGGVLLEELSPASLPESALQQALDHCYDLPFGDEPAPRPARAPAAEPDKNGAVLPKVLRDIVGEEGRALRWRSLMPGIAVARLPVDGGGLYAELYRIRPGRRIPRHTHGGMEAILMLAGGMTDPSGHYRRGDLQVSDETVEHGQVADADETCLCLLVGQGRLRLTGPILRLLNPLLRR